MYFKLNAKLRSNIMVVGFEKRLRPERSAAFRPISWRERNDLYAVGRRRKNCKGRKRHSSGPRRGGRREACPPPAPAKARWMTSGLGAPLSLKALSSVP